MITDGESNDRFDLDRAVNEAEAKGIIRFTIGVRHVQSIQKQSMMGNVTRLHTLPWSVALQPLVASMQQLRL